MAIFKILAVFVIFASVKVFGADITTNDNLLRQTPARYVSRSARLQGPAAIGRQSQKASSENVPSNNLLTSDKLSTNEVSQFRPYSTHTFGSLQEAPSQPVSPPVNNEPIENPVEMSTVASSDDQLNGRPVLTYLTSYEDQDCIDRDESLRNSYDLNNQMIATPVFVFRNMFDNMIGGYGSNINCK